MCDSCTPLLLVERALLFGERSGILQTLVNELKFSRKRAAYRHIAGLLGSLLPYRLPVDAAFVPLPTIARHIRQRGYDHTGLIARRLAIKHGATYAPVLRRNGQSVQQGASKHERIIQAERAFTVTNLLDPAKLYILVDDIVTTGSSVRFASLALRRAGARRIWILALARQPLT